MVTKAVLISTACLVLFAAVHLNSTMLVQISVRKNRRQTKQSTLLKASVHFVNHAWMKTTSP